MLQNNQEDASFLKAIVSPAKPLSQENYVFFKHCNLRILVTHAFSNVAKTKESLLTQ